MLLTVAAGAAPQASQADAVVVPARTARLNLGVAVTALTDDSPAADAPGGALVAATGLARAVTVDPYGRLTAAMAAPVDVTDPSAITDYPAAPPVPNELLVLDRARDRLLVLRGTTARGFTVAQTVAVGHEPVAMVVTGLNDDEPEDVAIADAASDAVTVLLGRKDGLFAPAGTLSAGARPVDLVAGDFDAHPGADLVVADQGAAALTVLSGDGNGGVSGRTSIALPAHPVALVEITAESETAPNDLNGDESADLAVAYGDAPSVSVLLSGPQGLRVAATTGLPGPGRPVALALGRFGPEGLLDVAIARVDPATVTLLLNDGRSHLLPQPPVAVGGRPSALIASEFAGDGGSDLLIGDASGGVEDLVPGDRLLRAVVAARRSLTAAAGALYYSRKVKSRWLEQRMSGSGARLPAPVRTLRIPPATAPVFAHAGRDMPGRRELAYVRCTPGRHCAAYAFTLPDGPERPIAVRRPAGCELAAFARWRTLSAYELKRRTGRSCPRPAIGLWLQDGRDAARRLTARPFSLELVRGRRVVYGDVHRFPDGDDHVRLRVATPRGAPRTISGTDADNCGDFDLGPAAYDRGRIYWTTLCGDTQQLDRARLIEPRCRSAITSFTADSDPQIAVTDGRFFYRGDHGILAVTPGRLRWPATRCSPASGRRR